MIKQGPLRWHGGNYYLKQWMWSLAPRDYTHRITAFAGGLQDFWAQPWEGISETINDADCGVANFYNCLRTHGDEMIQRLTLTPWSDHEWAYAAKSAPDAEDAKLEDVDAACAFFIAHRMSRQGLGTCFATPTKRIRRGMHEQVSSWLNAVDGLTDFIERLRRVEIRNELFSELLPQYDHAKAYFILDPPYLHRDEDGTFIREAPDAYNVEMTLNEHIHLLDLCAEMKGKFLLQGYPSKLYARYAETHGWLLHTKEVDLKSSSQAKKPKKTECIWTNYYPTAADKQLSNAESKAFADHLLETGAIAV